MSKNNFSYSKNWNQNNYKWYNSYEFITKDDNGCVKAHITVPIKLKCGWWYSYGVPYALVTEEGIKDLPYFDSDNPLRINRE